MSMEFFQEGRNGYITFLKVKPIYKNVDWEITNLCEFVSFTQNFYSIIHINITNHVPCLKGFIIFESEIEHIYALQLYKKVSIPNFGTICLKTSTRENFNNKKSPFDFYSRDFLSFNIFLRSTSYAFQSNLMKISLPKCLLNQYCSLDYQFAFKKDNSGIVLHKTKKLENDQTCTIISNMPNKTYSSVLLKLEMPNSSEFIPKSKVLLISMLKSYFDSSIDIFSLLSIFGPVKKVLFLRNQQKALVEFYYIEDSEICINFLTTKFVQIFDFECCCSKHKEIEWKEETIDDQNILKYNDFLEVPMNFNRFQKPRQFPGVISNKLFIFTAINKQNSAIVAFEHLKKLLKLFDQTAKIDLINTNSDEKFACFVKVCSIEKAVFILSKLNFKRHQTSTFFVDFAAIN